MSRFQKGFVFGVLLIGLTSASAFAQDASSAASSVSSAQSSSTSQDNNAPRFGMGFQFGGMTLNGASYNSFRLQPVFFIGKFGIGLDVNFEFDINGNFRYSEWNSWQAIITKILFIQYGFKKDTIYVKAGGIDDFTLGNGFIMKRYSNMLNYPTIKKMGLAFDLDLGVAGFESVVNNIFLFDILGARAYYRPLYSTDIPILKKLEIGATIAGDLGPQNPVPATNTPYDYKYASNQQPVGVYGVDIGLPIIDVPMVFDLRTYADFAQIAGKGTGEMLGIGGRIASLVPYSFEVRYLQPKFASSYFDAFYDAARPLKYDSLELITNSSASWLFSSGLNLMSDMVVWNFQIEGQFTGVVNPTLTMDFKLSKELFKMIDFHFVLIHQNLSSFGDVFDFANTNTIFDVVINVNMSENLILSLDNKTSFSVDPDGVLKRFSSTTVSTKLTF